MDLPFSSHLPSMEHLPETPVDRDFLNLLMSGADERSKLLHGGQLELGALWGARTSDGVRAYPESDVFEWSACQALSPSWPMFASAHQCARDLRQAPDLHWIDMAKWQRSHFTNIWGLPPSFSQQLVWGPSSAHMHLLVPGLIAASTQCRALRTIFVAPELEDEASLWAFAGRAPFQQTPLGKSTEVGQRIAGLQASLNTQAGTTETFPSLGARVENFQLERAIDAELRSARQENQQLILRVSHCDRAGRSGWARSAQLRRWVKRGAIALVDASIGRIEVHELHEYLELGCFVILSGSGFFGAPPHCAVLLIPPAAVAALKAHPYRVEPALAPYFSWSDFPLDAIEDAPLMRLESSEDTPWQASNPGLRLRWHCALMQMEQYLTLPVDLRVQWSQLWAAQLEQQLAVGASHASMLQVGSFFAKDARGMLCVQGRSLSKPIRWNAKVAAHVHRLVASPSSTHEHSTGHRLGGWIEYAGAGQPGPWLRIAYGARQIVESVQIESVRAGAGIHELRNRVRELSRALIDAVDIAFHGHRTGFIGA